MLACVWYGEVEHASLKIKGKEIINYMKVDFLHLILDYTSFSLFLNVLLSGYMAHK